VQAELDAYQDFLDGGCTNGRSFHLDSLGLTLKNWESFEVETSNAPPVANTDFVFANVGAIADSGANDSISNAAVLERSSFRLGPTLDVGNELLPRVTVQGSVDPFGDMDIFAVNLIAGEKLILDIDYGYSSSTISFPPPLASDVDARVLVRDASGSVVDVNDDNGTSEGGEGSVQTLDSYLEYTAPIDGTYFIEVEAVDYSAFPPAEPFSSDYVLNVSIDNSMDNSLGGVMILADALLANDTDPDGDTLFITNVIDTGNGELVQTNTDADGNVESVVFKPLTGQFDGSFDYTISDGTAGHEVTTTANVSISGGKTNVGDPAVNVTGGPTDDVLIGSAGNDVFNGDGGSDVFVFSAPSASGEDQIGNDTINGFVVGTDQLLLEAGVSVSGLAEVSGNTEVSFDSGGMVTLVGVTGIADVNDLFG
jgi:hypothetical protein